MKSLKVKREVLDLAQQIKMKKDELEKLNKKVEVRQNKFYQHQIDNMDHGKEVMKVITDIGILVYGKNGIVAQNAEMRTFTDMLITGLASKTINTHISMVGDETYPRGNIVIYNKGLGLKTSYDSNTKRTSRISTILEMLRYYGDEIVGHIPSPQKREVIKIFTSHAKTNKFGSPPEIKKRTYRVTNVNFDNIDTDIDSNYLIENVKIKNVGFEMSNRFNTMVRIFISTTDYSYDSDSIGLNLNVNSCNMYKIAITWHIIGKYIIKIRDDLIKLQANRKLCLDKLTEDLSPYTLALTI